ncbi:hypothetical protein [Desulfobulbus alkaliphilus]|uniref:hypothetical protein n=1 Tax=Desulfobulbus alkaliphilus TaxID=869814 RepID=UPI00196437F0|nr:hypothetical protein [Desulfobulbus alkaliphilus]MBM9535658.1 hypothetical protein [Desulfobulbus alkaliphilus]
MTIKPRQNLVIIKGVDHTDNILRITHESKHTVVTFKKGKTYRYTSTNVECFSSPENIPVDNYRFIVAGDVLSDVAEVLRFGNWVKIFHGSGGSRCCRFSEFSAKPMEASNGRSMDILAYFRELAEGVTLRTNVMGQLVVLGDGAVLVLSLCCSQVHDCLQKYSQKPAMSTIRLQCVCLRFSSKNRPPRN